MKIDTDLIDFVKKHDKKQIDDLIHYYLVQNNKLKESILFIDLIQGKNRFEQYKKSFIKLLELEEFHYVIEKSKEIKDNDLKIEIVLQLADKNLIDMAKKASKELIKSAQIRNLSNYGLIKFYARTMHGIDDDVRLTERLYLPSKKLRAFVSGKVGPKDGTDWVGGNYSSAVSAEAQLPNLLPESYRTDFSLFMDAGNIWGVDYSSSVSETNTIRSSVGLGAQVWTPVGPLSWTFSQNLSKADTDKTESFNFRLGTTF